jgi:hypothetical protein
MAMPQRYYYAYVLYRIGGWDIFEADAYEYEKRLRARRRRPPWADED